MICNAELCLNYFSVNVSIRAIVFRWQIKKKKWQFCLKLSGFLKIVGEIQELVQKRSQKILYSLNLHYILLPIYPLHFPKFCPIQKKKKKKNAKKLLVFCENDSCRLSKFLQTHIFWNFDYISRIYNQLITGIFDFQK